MRPEYITERAMRKLAHTPFRLRVACFFRGHVHSPGPVAVIRIQGQVAMEVYQCWRCLRSIPPP